jgi:hypothetical protein
MAKHAFEELLSGLVSRPKGKPVLVPESDKRPELDNIKKEFMED